MKRLLKKNELGNDARYLAQAGPGLAQTTVAAPALFHQTDLLSRCTSHNLIPAGNTVLQDSGPGYDFTTGQPNYREFFYSTVQLAGESQLFDGNGSYRPLPGRRRSDPDEDGQPRRRNAERVALGPQHLAAARHQAAADRARSRRRSGRTSPASRTPVPDLNGPLAAQGPPDPQAVP